MNSIKRRQRNAYRKDYRFTKVDRDEHDAVFSILKRRLKAGSYSKKINKQESVPEKKRETIGSMCRKMETQLPDGYTGPLENTELTDVAYVITMAKKGGALMLANRNAKKYQGILEQAREKEVAVVFADRKKLKKSGVDTSRFNVVPVDDGLEHFKGYYRPFRDDFNGTVIGITGSAGKTTTKEYVRLVSKQKGRTVTSPANFNSTHNVADNLLNRVSNKYEIYLQEVGGGSIGSVANSAQMLRPNIAVITNVLPHHLNKYKTIENVYLDKIQLVENLEPGGTAVVNFDNEWLAGHDYKCDLASFGINTNKAVRYLGSNVHQEGDYLHLDISYCEGSKVKRIYAPDYDISEETGEGSSNIAKTDADDSKKTEDNSEKSAIVAESGARTATVHVRSEIVGDYNAYNILAAFAVGKTLGLSDEQILTALSSYTTKGARQNVDKLGSTTLFMDCYNVCNETIINSVKVLESLDVPEGARRIAVVGGENKLGKQRIEVTRELGIELAQSSVDEIICYGTASDKASALNRYGDAKTLYETLLEKGFHKTELITSFDDLVSYMRLNIKKDDAVLFKTIVYLNMPAAVDKVFGTGYSLESKEARDGQKIQKHKGFTGYAIKDMNEIYLTDVSSRLLNAPKVTIPDAFGRCKVFGTNRGLMARCDAREIDFGNSIRYIGVGAFHGCTKLRRLDLPDSVTVIKNGAFRGCTRLEHVTIGKGIRLIEDRAFHGCNKLREVRIPAEADVIIEDGAIPAGVEIKRI